MCGIVGYIGTKRAYPILLEGLKKLEYRGYDSAGVALLSSDDLYLVKCAGEISFLEEKVGEAKENGFSACVGIGHTRWATHGRPSDENAHPHTGCSENFVVVHNGIIENYRFLRSWLTDEGHRFSSETDTEVLAHLVEHYYDGDLLKAVQSALDDVQGSYAIVVLSSHEPERLVCARKDSPLLIGLGEKDENIIASDLPAILAHTRRTYILEDGELAVVTAGEAEIYDRQGQKIAKEVFQVTWDAVAAEKGGYSHFMIKEIMEQPQAVKETLRGRINYEQGELKLDTLSFSTDELKKLEKIFIIACGTASHAGLIGKYALEKLARIPVEADLASEFRYRDPIFAENSLAIIISQSGETADTLAALRLVKEKGIRTLAITNVVGSSVAREADEVIFTWAGPEIAVASTKAYLTQLVVIYLLALHFADCRGMITAEELKRYIGVLQTLPEKLEEILADTSAIEKMAHKIARWDSAFFNGRNLDYCVAVEGALKLKEISYIHAEACAAGELKHGTLALITEGVPIVALATQDAVFEKTVSNIKEAKARGAFVVALAFEGKEEIEEAVDECIYLPRIPDLFAPILSAVPLQLIAYYAAVKRGCSVDKPRNLAKSVTVE